MKPLEEYVRTKLKKNNNCWVCNLPQRDEINNGIRAGLRAAPIREWLINEIGVDPQICTIRKISYHIGNSHHEKSS
jgi:hypothetical protein